MKLTVFLTLAGSETVSSDLGVTRQRANTGQDKGDDAMAESEAEKKKREQDAARFTGIHHEVGTPLPNIGIPLDRDQNNPKDPRVVPHAPVSLPPPPAIHTQPIKLACSRRELELLELSVRTIRGWNGIKGNEGDLELLEQKLTAALEDANK
jgi:hypothetical protein